MSTKAFWLINPDEQKIEMEFVSKTARDAALKAATRGYSIICLAEADVGKIHIFRGVRINLSEDKQNDYTRQRNINTKPHVSKLAYRNLKQTLRRHDVVEIAENVTNMMG